MSPPSSSFEASRSTLLEQIAAIPTMQPGTLAEEWRERPAPDGNGVVRLGPYYKHQVWKDGRNVSRRVPADQAALLREDIDNAKLYEQLTTQFAELTIEHTLGLRAAAGAQDEAAESKKNSRPKHSKKGTRRPKRSSSRQGRR